MKILLTKTLPTEDGLYYWVKSERCLSEVEILKLEDGGVTDGYENWMPEVIRGYWAKVDPSMFQLCESEQERREIIQKQHSSDTHRQVNTRRDEKECKCDNPTHICLNCVGWSKEGVE